MNGVATLSIKTFIRERDLLGALTKWEDMLFVTWTFKWDAFQRASQSRRAENFNHRSQVLQLCRDLLDCSLLLPMQCDNAASDITRAPLCPKKGSSLSGYFQSGERTLK